MGVRTRKYAGHAEGTMYLDEESHKVLSNLKQMPLQLTIAIYVQSSCMHYFLFTYIILMSSNYL